MSQKPTIAFVYDWFDTSVGGAERVIQELHGLYPEAPWFTSHIDHKAVPWAKGWDIRPSFLQHFPLWFRRNRILSLLLLPFAFESFDLLGYDTVVSVTSAFAKGVIANAKTRHICYLLTPPRWLYKYRVQSTEYRVVHWLIKRVQKYLENWDYVAAQRVDEYISISQEVARRCAEYYGRESEVVYPPFDYEKWRNLMPPVARHCDPESSGEAISLMNGIATSRQVELLAMTDQGNVVKKSINSAQIYLPYYLVVSRLESYKKVDVAIEAFAMFKVKSVKLKVPMQNEKLIIVGSGSQKAKLKALSSKLRIDDSVIWVDGLSDEELARLYSHCKAFIMPQEEDFGYVAYEAMACGAPIVAYARGGQTEILAEYSKKVLCDEQSSQCFAQALEKLGDIQYNAGTYENSHIRRGSRNTFVAAFSQKIPQTV